MQCANCGEYLPHVGGRGCKLRPSRHLRPSIKSKPSASTKPSRSNRPARKRLNAAPKTKLYERPIIGVDSEAQDDKLVLLAAASEKDETWYLEDRAGLRPEAMFDWLLGLPKGLKMGFAFNYDATMLFRHIHPVKLKALHKTGKTEWKHYYISHIPGKKVLIKDRRSGKPGVVIWDVWGWCQCSFARLIKEWNLGSEDERSMICRMKEQRAEFAALDLDEIRQYTFSECRLLAQWVRSMISLHEDIGLKLNAYSGAGSTASAMLRKYKYVKPSVPLEVHKVAESAYYGGRSEVSLIGEYQGEIHTYDINSAYPTALSKSPDVTCRWHRVKDPGKDWYGFGYVEWDWKQCTWGPFPVRGVTTSFGRCLALVYPIKGAGWYHSSEINPVRDRVIIRDAWVLDHNGDTPFNWIPTAAKERLAFKAAGDKRHVPLKLGLNAMYGKLAQRTGQAPHQCIVLAAGITASCRSQILELLMLKQKSILLVATDGIIATETLPVTVGAGLGEWSTEKSENCFIAQSGVYWAADRLKTRGFEMRYLDLEHVRNEWRKLRDKAVIEMPVRRFIGYRSASSRNNLKLAGTWESGTRKLKLTPRPRREPEVFRDGHLRTVPATITEYRQATFWDHVAVDPFTDILDDEQPDFMFDE